MTGCFGPTVTGGYTSDVTLTWHAVRDVESLDELPNCAGMFPGDPFGDPTTAAKAYRVNISTTDTSPDEFQIGTPVTFMFEHEDGALVANQGLCPHDGFDDQNVTVSNGDEVDIDVHWLGVKSPDAPEGTYAVDAP